MKNKMMLLTVAAMICGAFASLTSQVEAKPLMLVQPTVSSVLETMVCVRNGVGSNVRCPRLPKRGETIEVVYGDNPRCVVTLQVVGEPDQDGTAEATVIKIDAANKKGEELAPATVGGTTYPQFSVSEKKRR